MDQNPEVAQRILYRLGLRTDSFHFAEPQGIANETWLCGEWVVRISKDPEYLEDLLTESVAAPAAYAAGVRSAEPVHFCLTQTEEIPPFSVYRRVLGRPLSRIENLFDPEEFFRSYGRELRKMHKIAAVDDPEGFLDEAWLLDAENLIKSAAELNIQCEIERLLPSLTGVKQAFVHQDLHADNVLVDESGLPVFLDWGDAGFGDPAADFRYLPAEFLSATFNGYGCGDQALINRAKLHIFDQYVYCQKMGREYGKYGEATLRSLNEMLTNADFV